MRRDHLLVESNCFRRSTGRETRRDLANGMATVHDYDEAGRETGNYTSLNGDPMAATAARFTVTYDGVGNVLDIVELNGAATFTYDSTYQLVNENRSGPSPVDSTHAYDPVGNRLSKTTNGAPSTFAYDAANQITGDQTPDGSHDYAFDNAGNMTGVTTYDLAHTVTGIGTLAYDGQNRLIAQVGVTGPSDAQSFTYGGDDKRRQSADGAKSTRFVWDGENVLQDLDASNPLLPLLAQYTDYPGYWGGLISRRGEIPTTGRRALFNARKFNAARFNEAGDMELPSRFFGFDLMSNTRYLMDETGAITDSYIFEAFGDELYASGPDLNPYRFGGLVGYRRDRMNANYVRYRYYLALLARWLTADPIGFDGGDWNLNRYVHNRPTQFQDPSGLACYLGLSFPFSFPKFTVFGLPVSITGSVCTSCWSCCQLTQWCVEGSLGLSIGLITLSDIKDMLASPGKLDKFFSEVFTHPFSTGFFSIGFHAPLSSLKSCEIGCQSYLGQTRSFDDITNILRGGCLSLCGGIATAQICWDRNSGYRPAANWSLCGTPSISGAATFRVCLAPG